MNNRKIGLSSINLNLNEGKYREGSLEDPPLVSVGRLLGGHLPGSQQSSSLVARPRDSLASSSVFISASCF